MGEQAAWFFVWIPRKEEEKRLIQVEKEKQIEAARLQQQEELKVKEETRIKEEELRVKEEGKATEKTTEQKDVAPILSVVEQQKAEEVVGILQTGQSDWPPIDAVTDEAKEAEISGGGKGEGGSSASVRVIEVQEVSNPSPAPENNTQTREEALPSEEQTPVDIPSSHPAPPLLPNGAPPTAAPTSIASGLAALTTTPTEGEDPGTPLAEKKLEQVDQEEILTLEEILNKELANIVVSGLMWQPSRDKTTILAMFYVRYLPCLCFLWSSVEFGRASCLSHLPMRII